MIIKTTRKPAWRRGAGFVVHFNWVYCIFQAECTLDRIFSSATKVSVHLTDAKYLGELCVILFWFSLKQAARSSLIPRHSGSSSRQLVQTMKTGKRTTQSSFPHSQNLTLWLKTGILQRAVIHINGSQTLRPKWSLTLLLLNGLWLILRAYRGHINKTWL